MDRQLQLMAANRIFTEMHNKKLDSINNLKQKIIDMEIKQTNSETNGYFTAEKNGVEAGRMTYEWEGKDKFIIDHTEVKPEYKGQNIGKQMLMEAVAFARKNNYKIIPVCPFVKSMFERNDEIKDVLE